MSIILGYLFGRAHRLRDDAEPAKPVRRITPEQLGKWGSRGSAHDPAACFVLADLADRINRFFDDGNR